MSNKKITVVGSGYVGMSLAVLFSQHAEVKVFDIDKSRVEKINNKEATIKDDLISQYLSKRDLNLSATLDEKDAFKNAEFIIIATPTNYDETSKEFDTSSVEETISKVLKINQKALIVIKSTIPIGFTSSMQKNFNYKDIVFSPEFLREGMALEDNLNPSRIIFSSQSEKVNELISFTKKCVDKKDIKIIFMKNNEAESVKLFSNTFLAMRVSFFNELDTFSLDNDLNANSIIEGISSDPRIGNYYNNPSFGYGGYCLPKDTKQLENNFNETPQTLITATIKSNQLRKEFIANKILKRNPKKVGVYRLLMKDNSDNFREAAIFDIIKVLEKNAIEILIYEPLLSEDNFESYKVINNLNSFTNDSDIILANRYYEELKEFKNKVFTRDIFGKD